MFDFILGNTVFTKAIMSLLFYWNTKLVGVDDIIQKHDTCNVEDRADKEKVACFSEKEVRRLSRNGYQSE